MQLKELILITNKLFYDNSPSYKVITSKQNELLRVIKPTTNIKKIDYKLINKYMDYLKQNNNSPKTINDKLSYLSKILKYAYNNGLIDYKPTFTYQKVIAHKDKFLDVSEKIQMLLWCKHNKQIDMQHIILIGLYTGLRINNILSLNKSMYKDNKLYIYDKKVNRYHTIPVSNKIKYIIINLKPFNIDYNKCYYIFNQMKKELNLDKDITIHTLRHTFCSDLVNKNISLPIIQTLANHKRLQTTLRYTHVNEDKLQDAINIL
jgi:site-specific recombinase XerD